MENLPQKKEKLLIEELIAEKSKLELIRSFSNLTIKNIIENKTPSIGQLKKQHGFVRIENALTIICNDLNDSFENELSTNSIDELVVELSTGLNNNLTLEDVYLAFKELKYNNSHGKITLNKILKAISNHFNEKINMAEQISLSEHLAYKEQRKHEDLSSIVKEAHHIAKAMYLSGQLKPIKPKK